MPGLITTALADDALLETELARSVIVELSLNDKGEPPTEFRLLKAGMNRTAKGTLLFSEKSATSVISRYADEGNERVIDYGHAANAPSWVVANPAEAGKAAGWHRIEVRDGELWATNVSWTPAARKSLTDREYRFFSPTVRHTEDGEVMEYVNCALTNIPATYGLTPLMASKQPEPQPKEDLMDRKLIIAMFNLPADATDAQIQAKLTEAKTKAEAADSLTQLTGAADTSTALGNVRAAMANAGKTAELEAQLSKQKAEKEEAELNAVLDAAERDRKIAPAQRTIMLSLGKSDRKQLDAFLAAAPAVVPAPAKAPAPAGAPSQPGLTSTALTAEDSAVGALFGISTTDLSKAKESGLGRIVTANGQMINGAVGFKEEKADEK